MTPDGAVRAMVGGRNYAESQYNRAVTAKRQPGSAFKPFVFLTAVEAGLTPETIRLDAPLDIKGWRPENYTHEYFGSVTLTQALAMSLNTVAVRLGIEVGPKNVVRTAHRLGISSKLEANASIALGTSEVSLNELVGAYAPFANGGLGISPHVVTKIRTNEGKVLYRRQPDQLGQVIEPRHVAMMNTMMRETLLSGTARKAEIPGWMAAGKTGTSQDFRDAWFIGYTANLVTGVWLGNDDNSPTKKATGGGLPVEVWTRFMRAAHQGVPVAGLPSSQRGGLLSNLFQTASQDSARRQASQHRRRYRSRRPPRAVRTGRRRRAPRRRHPTHRRVRNRRQDWMAGWWTGCSGGKRLGPSVRLNRNGALDLFRRVFFTRTRFTSLENALAGKDDPRFHRNAPVQILDVVVHEPDASGRDQMADGLGRIRAVNEQPRLVQQQRACAQRTAGTAGRREQRVGVLCVRARRPPVRPFKLVHDAREAAALQALLRNADPVTACGIVGIDQIEKAVFPIDHDRTGNDGGAVEHHLPLQRKRQDFARRAAIDAGLQVRHDDIFAPALRIRRRRLHAGCDDGGAFGCDKAVDHSRRAR